MNTELSVDFAAIEAAAGRLSGVANKTPVLTSRTMNELTGAEIFFKAENLQRIGAFKFRGAFNAVASLSEQSRRRGVIAFSSGNHAQAMALAGQILHCPTTIVMPEDAPPLKLAATRGYGARVVLYDRYKQNREQIANELADQDGLSVIAPFNHPDVIAGQGTTAKELIEEVGELDVLVVCVGGGGLIAGCSIAATAMSKNCQVIGVEPLAGNDVQQSMQQGKPVRIAVPQTIADGAQTEMVGSLTFPIIQKNVSHIETVNDDSLVRAMRWFGERMKLIVEPTGCLAAAAVMDGVIPVQGKRVGVILSGGNVDMMRYCELLTQT